VSVKRGGPCFRCCGGLPTSQGDPTELFNRQQGRLRTDKGDTGAHHAAQSFACHLSGGFWQGIQKKQRALFMRDWAGLTSVYKTAIAEQSLWLPAPVRQPQHELSRSLEETREPAPEGWCLRWTRWDSGRKGCFCWRRSLDCPCRRRPCAQRKSVQRCVCLLFYPFTVLLNFEQLMVVTALSNILGLRLHVVTPCLLLMSNRLHGIGEEVYPEGTHLMVPTSSKLVDARNPDWHIRFLGSRHPSYMTSEPSPEVSPA